MHSTTDKRPLNVRELRTKLKMLRQYQARSCRFETVSYYCPRHPVFEDFFRLLAEHDWFSDDYRWCRAQYQGDRAAYENAIDEANAYWNPKAVLCRQPTYKEALQCARFIYRCGRIMEGSPWLRALSMGVVQWIMDGIIEGPADCGQHAQAEQ
jgi:hypothetical protein